MKIDSNLSGDLEQIGMEARRIEEEGFDGVWVGETNHEPFLQCLQAGNATTRLEVGTSIAIAFARTPMTLATTAYDLQRYTDGRFILGLGSQVKPHIERRFSMAWSHPAARMRELVLGIRAIWGTWQDGTALDFRGEFYTHTLMTPFFAPPPLRTPLPKVFLAGVGELMTEVAGEVADGFFVHPFSTAAYVRDVTLPALERGAAKAGRTLSDLTVCGSSFITVADDEEGMARASFGTRKQIAFYASTPAYRAVLDKHGWGELQPQLTRMSKEGLWDEMAGLITDEMLAEFSVVGDSETVGCGLVERFGDIVGRLRVRTTYDVEPGILPRVAAATRAAHP